MFIYVATGKKNKVLAGVSNSQLHSPELRECISFGFVSINYVVKPDAVCWMRNSHTPDRLSDIHNK